MEDKVILFDANNAKLGETFMRRARQLVNQQRAEWIDDSHRAIRFAPDVDEWEKEVIPSAKIISEPKDGDCIYELAEKRLHERKMFIMHTVGLIPGYFGIIVLYSVLETVWTGTTEGFAWFLTGAWTMAYAIHAYFFAKTRLKGFRLVDREERRTQRLVKEVDRLKRMGCVDKA